MKYGLMLFVLLSMAIGLLNSADTASIELRPALEKTYASAIAAGDWWTALQCEAYITSRKIPIRFKPILGSSRITGNPLFAFPSTFVLVKDSDERIFVATSDACYTIAADGRPLDKAQRFEIPAESVAISFADDFLTAISPASATEPIRPTTVVVRNMKNNTELWRSTLTQIQDPQHFYINQSAIAHDGSAVLAAFGPNWSRTTDIVLVQANEARVINGFHQPTAVGTTGKWFIAEQITEFPTDDHPTISHPVLHIGEENHAISQWAVGPGIAVILTQSTSESPSVPTLVNSDGSLTALLLPINLADGASVFSVGNYVVIGSGTGASARPVTDLLGNSITNSKKQPVSYVIYRWEDLLASRDKASAFSFGIGTCLASQHHPASLYVYKGKTLQLVDLSSSAINQQTLGEFGHRITSMTQISNRLRIVSERDIFITDSDGLILWQGAADSQPRFHGPDWISTSQKDGDKLVNLVSCLSHPDHLYRNVQITVKPLSPHIQIDHYGRFGAIQNDAGGRILFNTSDGSSFERVNEERIIARRRWDFPGRFAQYGARLYDKKSSPPSGAQAEWILADALITPQGSVVLDDLSYVWINKRDSDIFTNIGWCPGASALVNGDKGIVLINASKDIVGKLIPGPKIAFKDLPTRLPDENPGPWKYDTALRFFTLPKTMIQHQWSREKSAFTPITFHSTPVGSPASSPLTLITRSLIIELEAHPATLRLCTIPVTP